MIKVFTSQSKMELQSKIEDQVWWKWGWPHEETMMDNEPHDVARRLVTSSGQVGGGGGVEVEACWIVITS
jgi:hypothetical protein